MKDLIPNKYKKISVPFIKNYLIKGNNMIIYTTNHKTATIPYTKEREKIILETMKIQAEEMSKYKDYYKKEANSNIELSMFSYLFTLINASILSALSKNNNLEWISILLTIWCSAFGLVYSIDAFRSDKKIKEIEKYEYFLENEELINHEIVRRYFDFYGSYANIKDANNITINDIDKYTKEDLECIVELIKSSDEYKLEHKRA